MKTFENLLEFGFSEVPAGQLLELAYKRHGDQAGDYLEQWTKRINNYSWVENPQGYMRRAIAENWSLPKQKRRAERHSTQVESEWPRPGRAGVAAPKSRLSRGSRAQIQIEPGQPRHPYSPVDYSKYLSGGKYAHLVSRNENEG